MLAMIVPLESPSQPGYPAHPWVPPTGGAPGFPAHPIAGGGYPSHPIAPPPPLFPSNPIYRPDKPQPQPPGGGDGGGGGGNQPSHPWVPPGGIPPQATQPIVQGGWVLVFHPAYGYQWIPASNLGGSEPKPQPEPMPPPEIDAQDY